MIVRVSMDAIKVASLQLIMGNRSTHGWAARVTTDAEDTSC